jgi:hypothetical protein
MKRFSSGQRCGRGICTFEDGSVMKENGNTIRCMESGDSPKSVARLTS